MQLSAFGGFRTHAPGTTSQSILLSLHLPRETCGNGCGKTTTMIPLIIFVFGEFGSPEAGAKELLYSLNLIHKFTSLFSTSLLYVGLPRKAFAGKQAKVDTGHQCFSVVAQAAAQDSPKGSPMAIFEWKNLIGQLNPLLEWMLNESWRRWRRLSLLSSTCQHVAKLQFVSCAEEASLCGRVVMAWIKTCLSGWMPWCSFPWHKLLPRLVQKKCYTTL